MHQLLSLGWFQFFSKIRRLQQWHPGLFGTLCAKSCPCPQYAVHGNEARLMAWALIEVRKAFLHAAAVAASSLPLIGRPLRMAAFLQLHVAKLMACPLRSWDAIYVKYDIHASTLVRVPHNKAQQSLPLVAGTAKTLRLIGRPCVRRYLEHVCRYCYLPRHASLSGTNSIFNL
jgi:hypothetical protein